MDHIKNILNSDLLERYVLGEVTPKEKMEVDLLCVEHRQIREALVQIEKTLEATAKDNAITPPLGTKECIIKNINSGNSPVQNVKSDAAPKVNNAANLRSIAKYAAVAIAGCFLAWLGMQSALNSANTKIENQEKELLALHESCDQLGEQYAFVNHTNTIPVLLNNSNQDVPAQVVIYWNDRLQQSMMRVVELPAIEENQTFQLWADVDNHMLSLGTFDAANAITDALAMSYMENATSLNITIEPKGGSKQPTLATLTASELIRRI